MRTFPEDPETAVAIAKAESNLIPWAYNPEAHRGCAGSIGVMQIACVHYDGDPRDLHDVALNLRIARSIYEEQGWKPWGAYTDRNYLRYLAKK